MMFANEFYDSMRVSWLDLELDAQIVPSDDDDSAMPAELRNWLVRLRLLEGVPFANLVADAELLPPESIRWFHVDRRWTDALVQGALSVGTVNSDDRAQLTSSYAAIREELDDEERNVRRQATTARRVATASDAESGTAGPISGFLLRSAAVSGWPAIHVRAFDVDPAEGDGALFDDDDPRRIRLLRLERLAPAVLLCLFDGIPRVVHLEEPRQGIQFGFDVTGDGAARTATRRPRDKVKFEYLPVDPVSVPFRVGTSGVVDIRRLRDALEEHDATGAGDGLDSAEYALQLIRFPWRQVWGDVDEVEITTVFQPTIAYAEQADSFTTFDYQPRRLDGGF